MTKFKWISLIAAALGALAIACGGAAPVQQPAAAPQQPAVAPAPQQAPAAPAPQAPRAPAPAAPAAPAMQAVQPPPAAATAVPAATAAPVVRQPVAPEDRPAGTLVTATVSVHTPSGFPTDCLWCSTLTYVNNQESLLKAVRTEGGALTAAPWLAKAWATAPDLSYTDFELNQGVMFHKGHGEMTARDIEWTYKALLPSFTSEARHDTSGSIDIAVGDLEPLDDYNLRITWDSFAGHTLAQIMTDISEGTGIFPHVDRVMEVNGFSTEEEAHEWMRTNIVGTGPFVMDGWVAQNGMFMSAVIDHWEKTPFVQEVRAIEVPEPSVRRAQLETGEAQIAELALKDWRAMLDTGEFALAPEGIANVHAFPFGGNFWEYKHAVTGDVLDTVRDTSLPWVGDPFEGGGEEFNPDTASMQSSLKVRQALRMAIDREALNDVILGGLGKPAYLAGQTLNDPVILENGAEWELPYDVEGAKALLAEAGYGDGFEVTFWAGLSNEDVELSDAIAADWLNNFNITAVHDRRTYSTIRPGLVTRTFPVLRMHPCCGGPSTWPLEQIWSSYGRNGYNHGLEVPKAAEVNKIKNETADQEVLYQVSVEMRQYFHEWALMPAIIEAPSNALYNVNAIDGALWAEGMRPMLQFRNGGISEIEWIKLK